MRLLHRLRLRLRSLFRSAAVERELSQELQFHLDQLTEENLAAGMAPAEARAAAQRTLGGVAQLAEECRDARGTALLEELAKDARYALRILRRAPGFTAVAVLTLGLGIGATTAIFSVVYGVLLKPLPFPQPERLVGVWHAGSNHGPGTYFTYRDQQRVFEDLGAWEHARVSVTGRGEPERVQALTVTEATLPLLGFRPLFGRLFDAADVQPRAPGRVLLGHAYWQGKLGGAHDVIGQHLQIDGTPREIVGVLPPSFVFLDRAPALVLPMALDRANIPSPIFDFQILARLKPGVTLARAEADLARMIRLLPPAYGRYRLQPDVHPLHQDLTGQVGRVLWILLATVGLVLLIACANVANLFLVRAQGRQRELAVRAALGARRGRLARQLLTESLVLALAGGLVGLLLASACLSLLRRLAAEVLPRVGEIGLHPAVLLFTLAVSALTGLLFGLLPVLRLGAPSVTVLKQAGRLGSEGPAQRRARNTLVVAEVALALVLLIGAGLMIRTLLALRQVPPGFTGPEQVQTFRVRVPPALAAQPEEMVRTHERIAQRLRQVPGVAAVGLASSLTMDGEDNLNPIFVEHLHAPYDKLPPHRRWKAVAPGFFATMGNPLVAGRPLTWTDVYQRTPVILVSATLAREHWDSPAAALGKRIGFPDAWRQIVGVVGDEHDDGLHRPPTAVVYWPALNDRYQPRTMSYAVRSPRVGSPGFVRELQQAVWSVSPSLPLAELRTLDRIRADAMARTAFAMVLLAIAAAVALLLGLVGIYGVISYLAAQRTREIGIRMAVGAQVAQVRSLFLRQGLALTAAGIAVGLVLSSLLTRVMSSLLFGVGPLDPLTYLAVSAGLAAVALLATWLPARRAAHVDPMTALRADG